MELWGVRIPILRIEFHSSCMKSKVENDINMCTGVDFKNRSLEDILIHESQTGILSLSP